MNTLSLQTHCDRSLIESEVSSQRTVELVIAVPTLTPQPERTPLNLALVLDRSGSMQGDKLAYVQQAACHVLDQLDERDQITVVAYDDEIMLLSPAVRISAAVRRDLKARINQLQPGGMTDLAGGWLRGCDEIARRTFGQALNRALLLTDGLANKGIVDQEELAYHARELRRRGVSTSTFGVGLDFNEHMLEALAAQGGGHFYYIERPQQIPELFRGELGELLTVSAREATLRIAIPPQVAVELLGDLPHELQQGYMRIFLGDLCGGEERRLYLRILTPPASGTPALRLSAELAYVDLAARAQVIAADLSFIYAPTVDVLRTPVNQAVLHEASQIDVAAAAALALKLERSGQRTAAQNVMQQTLAANAPTMPAPAAAAYQALSDQMAEGLTEETRKSAHYEGYKRRQNRK